MRQLPAITGHTAFFALLFRTSISCFFFISFRWDRLRDLLDGGAWGSVSAPTYLPYDGSERCRVMFGGEEMWDWFGLWMNL